MRWLRSGFPQSPGGYSKHVSRIPFPLFFPNNGIGKRLQMPVTIRCKGCGHILYQGRDIVIVKLGRNSSYSILEVLIGTSYPVRGRVLRKPSLNHIENRAKQKKMMEVLAR